MNDDYEEALKTGSLFTDTLGKERKNLSYFKKKSILQKLYDISYILYRNCVHPGSNGISVRSGQGNLGTFQVWIFLTFCSKSECSNLHFKVKTKIPSCWDSALKKIDIAGKIWGSWKYHLHLTEFLIIAYFRIDSNHVYS